MNRLLIFDLDGVITSEADYWATARRGVQQLLGTATDPLPPDFIYWCKNHAINHNWDVAFVALSAFEAGRGRRDPPSGLETRSRRPPLPASSSEDRALFCQARQELTGRALLESCDGFRGARWEQCHELCQALQDAGPLPTTCLHSKTELRSLFQTLKQNGFICSIATGRPRREALAPIDNVGIREYFDDRRIVTHDEVQQAEASASVPLGKPHPFVALAAMYPDLTPLELLGMKPAHHPGVWFIGDTISDVKAARAAGVEPIGILAALPPSTYRTDRKRALREAGCDTILESVLALPQCVI